MGYPSKCMGPTSKVQEMEMPTMLYNVDFLEELTVLEHGLKTLLGMFGETKLKFYFRESDETRHHAFIHAEPMAQYEARRGDVDFLHFKNLLIAMTGKTGRAVLTQGPREIGDMME